MEAILTKCFICDVACVAHDKYLGLNIARTLTMPMVNILDKCLRAHIDAEKEIFCAECANKIEEYDQVVQLSLQIETELYELYHRKVTTESCYLIDAEIIEPDKNSLKYALSESTEDEIGCHYDGMTIEYLDDHLNDLNSRSELTEHSPQDVKLELAEEEEEGEEEEEDEEGEEDEEEDEDEEISSPPRQKPQRKSESSSMIGQVFVNVYKCKKCDFESFEYDEYQDHRTEHETEQRFVCDMCGRSYKSKSALTSHIGIHANKNQFECELCNKTFTQRGALARHMPIHTGEKPHQCDVCGKRFIHYSSFHMHQMIHTNERRKKCKICGLELRSNSHMSRHMRVHTGEKPFECPICKQKFAQRYNMKTHYNTHQGIHRVQTKNHKCILCDQAFARRERLSKHLVQEHGLSKQDGDLFVEEGPNSKIADKILKNSHQLEKKEDILVEYIDDVDGEFESITSIDDS